MIKIAVFIKPQKVIKKKILYLKQDVKKKLGAQPYLAHPPHCTLFTINVSEKILRYKKNLNSVTVDSKLNKEISIIKTDIFNNDPITGGKTIFFKIKKNIFLNKLQAKLLNKFSKYKKNKIGEKFKFKWMKKNNDNYGYPFVGKHWKPHFTIASLVNISNDKKFINKFLNIKNKNNEKIKKIYVYKVKGDLHSYLWSINIKNEKQIS